MMLLLAQIALGLALLPLALALLNLAFFRRPRAEPPPGTRVSILIPARDEAAGIEAAVRSALSSRGVTVEVVVLDDHSTDGTAGIVERLAREDARVRLERAPPLPPGFNGKQHACHVLARHARHDLLLFMDADVRLAPDAAARAAGFLEARGSGLVSGFPRQVTGTLAERLVIPLIHMLLLGYLPMPGMRWTRHAAFGAGCGQLMLARREAYEHVGGHAAIRTSLHDGVTLPRAFRRKGLHTDLFDATHLAECRMYRGFDQVWRGFAKNATEGMATPMALPVWTMLLGGGHLLPWLLLPLALWLGDAEAARLAALAAGLGLGLRALLAARFRQSPLGALLHPLGITLLLAIQAAALRAKATGRPAVWRGRAYP
ncbi:MAG TPA: glycosyltransferase [Azospirillaceae bacterium]|nr:glycosyltransferase [Azospirillaceae bacterium]